jgi:hypothetical protein
MAHFLIDKRSTEKLSYIVDFSEILGLTDTSLQAATVTIYDSAGVDKTATILQVATLNNAAMTVALSLKDGLDGEDYTIYVKGSGNNESLTVSPVRVIELRVRDNIVGNK